METSRTLKDGKAIMIEGTSEDRGDERKCELETGARAVRSEQRPRNEGEGIWTSLNEEEERA